MISELGIQRLKKTVIIVRKGRKLVKLNAYTAENDDFIAWVAMKMGASLNENRLKFRLKVLDCIKGYL